MGPQKMALFNFSWEKKPRRDGNILKISSDEVSTTSLGKLLLWWVVLDIKNFLPVPKWSLTQNATEMGPVGQPDFKHLQEWGRHNFSGQSVPVLHHLHRKYFFLISNLNLLSFSLKSFLFVLSLQNSYSVFTVEVFQPSDDLHHTGQKSRNHRSSIR